MSQVFSFRLNENSPREVQARQVIETWTSRGFSLRYILVEALLTYAGKDAQRDDLSSNLEQIVRILSDIKVVSDMTKSQPEQDKLLPKTFLNAIAKTTRPGLKAE